MRNLLGYHDKIWAPYKEFEYTGNYEEFTLPAGEYLLECDGAPGGKTTNYAEPLYGGTSYGVLNISEPKTLYAFVGGVGEDGNDDHVTIGRGGWNGGGDGGEPVDGYNTGAGGGGATDIRCSLKPPEIIEYELELDTTKYEYLDYCITDAQNGGAIHTDYFHKKDTYVEYECNLTGSRTRDYEALFGSRNSPFYNAFGFFYRMYGRDNGCLLINTIEQEGSGTTAPYGQDVIYKIDRTKAEWYDSNDTKLGEIDVSVPYAESAYPFLIFDTADGTDFDDSSYGSLTFYKMCIYEQGVLKKCYIPAKTKAVDVTSEFTSELTWEQGTITSSGNEDSSTRVRTPGYLEWDYKNRPRSFRIFATDSNGNDLDYNVMEYDALNGGYISDDGWLSSGQPSTLYGHCRSIRFCLKFPNDSDITPSDVGSVRIEYTADEVGIYEVLSGTFAQAVKYNEKLTFGNCHLTAGNVLVDPTITLKTKVDESLASRIIVAGGGGGQMWITEQDYFTSAIGFGGGEVGGSPIYQGNNGYKYPTQTDGYSFGTGETPIKRTGGYTWNYEGAGGGGGGWFGGYSASITDSSYTSTNGGGGSGYVLTSTSYRPYSGAYEPPSDLELTDTFLGVGTSETPKIVIYKEIDSLMTDDIITFPCVGRSEHIRLMPGIYNFECYGGDGGFRNYYYLYPNNSRGGYAAGTFETTIPREAYINVGGSGLFANWIDQTWCVKYNPTMSYNGGGRPGSTSQASTAGGGGTDIRIDTDSLYARIIVAGGAGSEGRGSSLGGHGGGEVGGWASWETYGTTPGPGTQTESPYNSSAADICGAFGVGGNGKFDSDGYGGAGGGGWFGGSGTWPDGSSDDDEGGCGGSGYVLLPNSFKPSGYLLTDPSDCLTDTALTAGGNNLPTGRSLVRITVVGIKSKFLCSNMDMTNFYRFNDISSEWESFAYELPSDDDFNTYGSSYIVNDIGLPDDYKIIFKAPSELTRVALTVVPKEQTIRSVIEDDMGVKKTSIDVDSYDPSVFGVDCDSKRIRTSSTTTVQTDLKLTKKTDESNKKLKVFTVDVYSI